ncbi:hypothetical protein [Rugamonas rubra]|uniref:Uncharacterized protein n=1 Tax=Rugamonas rubra TaxID=758825 RepID=A0A1I4I305_9BURK|nr:hypothetical protein [Rugamonas rubra]SFL48749.1 hypothetical protein SAMN02982985_00428 [Rugamonas rubra]
MSLDPTPTGRRAAAWRFALLLGALLLALLLSKGPAHNGDAVEYSLQTIALVRHGSPDIRLDDIAVAKQLVPSRVGVYQIIEDDMRANKPELYAAFTRGKDGRVYAVHFFGYALLTALPFKLLQGLGVDPFKAYQLVNLGMLFVLGMSLFRLFGSTPKALLALALFMLSGGAQYWDWGSPECLSAAALLAALILYCDGAPLRAGLLAGLAALQNPTIVFFFGFAPLLRLCLLEGGARARLAALLRPRYLAALALGLAVFAVPPLYNLWQFGVPNIIVKLFSDPTLVNPTRLHSFYFDLNQGMLIGIPGVWAALLLFGWRGRPAAERRRNAALLGLCLLFSLALSVPALAVLNWNSGATGVMRYAFWGGAAFLFPLLWRLRDHPRWPLAPLLAVALVQALFTYSASRYHYLELSPLSRWVMQRAPGLVNPEPEIFAERNGHNDGNVRTDQVYGLSVEGPSNKLLYNLANGDIDVLLCGEGNSLAADNHTVDTMRHWRYINGPVRCKSGGGAGRTLAIEQFQQLQTQLLAFGWSNPERNGSGWDGVWSNGPNSRLQVAVDAAQPPATLTLSGYYFAGNRRSRLSVNGVDLGWHDLQQGAAVALPAAVRGASQLQIELAHEAPGEPGPGDQRHLALFLRKVVLR